MRKKGISFSLTMVVVGIILLLTALSVITLSGQSIGGLFDWTKSQKQSAKIEDKCIEQARTTDDNYCSHYIQNDVCSNHQANRDPANNYNNTATDEGCDWVDNYGGWDGKVTVSGDTYNCVSQGIIDKSCPADD